MNSKLYRCGWCGHPIDAQGQPLKGKSLEKSIKILKNYESVKHVIALNGWCCPDGDGSHEDQMVQVTRDMASDAGDPSMEGQWIKW